MKAEPDKNSDVPDQVQIGCSDFGTLCICALRYCMGRKTYMPDLVRTIVRPHLPQLTDKDIRVMLNDCAFQTEYELFGDERIDKSGWVIWKEVLEDERVRRQKRTEESS